MDIEPEKEVVLILSRVERTDQIVDHIRKELKIDEPGNGIIFLQTVNRAYGVPEGTEDSNVL
jgi:nitrogen regulatory protein PII